MTNEQKAIQTCLRLLSGVTKTSSGKYILIDKFSQRYGQISGAARMAIPFTKIWVDAHLSKIASAAFDLREKD